MMKYRPSQENKTIANNLAEAIYNKNIDSETLKKETEKLAFNLKDSKKIKIEKDPTDKIGIWNAQNVDGKVLYGRDASRMEEFMLWADVQEIKPKGEKFRVILLGESVARGFLLDRAYNPAIALDSILQNSSLDAEVIDLAKTNCSINELEQLATECTKLDPDAIVIFAGNNWELGCKESITNHEFAGLVNDSIEKNNLDSIKEFVESKLSRQIDHFFKTLAGIKKNVPILMINPEFNHKDWRSNSMEQIPMLDSKNLSAWEDALKDTYDSLDKNNYQAVNELSETLIRMYPSNPLGYELQGKARYHLGDFDGALDSYRKGHDTVVYQTSHCPGVTTFSQNKIIEAVNFYGFELVDLAQVFSEESLENIPDKTYFLDYCHLSVEGINLAMLHTANGILSMSQLEKIELTQDQYAQLKPDHLSLAAAHFLAAIHNAHWGQEIDIVQYHCAKALSFYDLRNEMEYYALMVSSIMPWRLNKYFGRLLERKYFSHYFLLAQPEDGKESFDKTLTDAIVKVLKDVNIDISEKLTNLRLKEHVFENNTVDLLKSRYWMDFNYNLNPVKSSFYRSYMNSSKFYIVCEGDSNTELDLVHRVPCVGTADDIINIEVNGHKLSSIVTSSLWRVDKIDVPKELLNDGLNEIVIHWPIEHIQNKFNHTLTSATLAQVQNYLYPILGEIHSFTMNVSSSHQDQDLMQESEIEIIID